MNSKLKKIYTKLESENLNCLIVSSSHNITYLTDYISRDSYLIISKDKNFYITDSRYIEEAKKYLSKEFILKKANGSVFAVIAQLCHTLKTERVGFEERIMPFAEYQKIKENLDKNIKLVPTHGLIEGLRQIKSPEELKKIKKAVQITAAAWEFIRDFIQPGKTELEIAGELERFIRYNGAYSSSFDIIVASGPNSSYPHHLSSDRIIRNNEPVLIDIGVDYYGYKSDLTRMLFLGRITPLFRRVYDIVKEAQNRAIKKIKTGVFINKIDAAARQYIAQKGYGGFFGHNLGHGIGLEIHEEPHISLNESNRIKPGMVFTVEPGIYIPGKFGVRIEDMVLVTERRAEVLSGILNK